MSRHLSTFAFGLTVIAMLLDGRVFNALAYEESHDDGQESSADILSTDAGDWKGQSVDVVGARVVDVRGQVHRLGVGSGATSFVIVFIGKRCPESTRYAPDLNRFSSLARESGLTMYGVISDPYMSATQARAFVAEYELDFTVLWDASGDLARRLQPTITPEVFVISPKGSVLYRVVAITLLLWWTRRLMLFLIPTRKDIPPF